MWISLPVPFFFVSGVQVVRDRLRLPTLVIRVDVLGLSQTAGDCDVGSRLGFRDVAVGLLAKLSDGAELAGNARAAVVEDELPVVAVYEGDGHERGVIELVRRVRRPGEDEEILADERILDLGIGHDESVAQHVRSADRLGTELLCGGHRFLEGGNAAEHHVIVEGGLLLDILAGHNSLSIPFLDILGNIPDTTICCVPLPNIVAHLTLLCNSPRKVPAMCDLEDASTTTGTSVKTDDGTHVSVDVPAPDDTSVVVVESDSDKGIGDAAAIELGKLSAELDAARTELKALRAAQEETNEHVEEVGDAAVTAVSLAAEAAVATETDPVLDPIDLPADEDQAQDEPSEAVQEEHQAEESHDEPPGRKSHWWNRSFSEWRSGE